MSEGSKLTHADPAGDVARMIVDGKAVAASSLDVSTRDGMSSHEPDPRDWLAAIIDGSEDAIISKDLTGTIQSWNEGATRLFGYAADEVIGRSITILIPEERLDEETHILGKIRSGERVEHFETKRRRKDGSPIDISLTISPIRSRDGVIVGASKIARDITERREAQEKQRLLFREMQHRVKNLLALTAGVVSLSARSAGSIDEIVKAVHGRLTALARAHDLTMTSWTDQMPGEKAVDLLSLLNTILEPYDHGQRITVDGANTAVRGNALTNVALLLHELTTNAAKYGSLSVPEGRLSVQVEAAGEEIRLLWTETGGPEPGIPASQGFGSKLERNLQTAIGAKIERDWQRTGLVIRVRFDRDRLVE